MKTRAQSLLEDVRAQALAGRRACEWLGEPVPVYLQGDPSPRTLELIEEARSIGGAYRFHQWAVSQLPSNVWNALGHRFVLGVNHRIERAAIIMSAAESSIATCALTWRTSTGKLGLAAPPDAAPKSPARFDCPVCPCGTKYEWADCLIYRFRDAFESITADSIAKWYSGLTGLAVTDVREFFRVEATSEPKIRAAYGQILSQELLQREGLPVTVNVNAKKTRPRITLRDAFTFTAMVAVHEWLEFKLVDGTNDDCTDDCAALVAGRFGIAANTLRRRWEHAAPKVRENIRLYKPPPL